MVNDDEGRPPSWRTAKSETEAALRHTRQATAALERVAREVEGAGDWGDRRARVEAARALTQGPDGGVLGLLVAAAAAPAPDPEAAARLCRMVLDRLGGALGLKPLAERGELLRLSEDRLREFEVRGPAPSLRTGLFRVARVGWLADGTIVARPLVEQVEDPADDR